MNTRFVKIALITAIAFLVHSFVPNQTPEKSKNLSQKPQFLMENFSQKISNKDGVFDTKISGTNLKYFSKKAITLIQNPKILLNFNTEVPWVIQANSAINTEEKWQLSGAVSLQKNHKKFNTELIEINPKTAIVKTDKPIVITDNQSKTTGIGLTINTKKNIINILSNANTTYEKPR